MCYHLKGCFETRAVVPEFRSLLLLNKQSAISLGNKEKFGKKCSKCPIL